MATLDNAIWLTGTNSTAADGSTVISEGGRSTTVSATFTPGTWDATQNGYNVSQFGAFGVTTSATIEYDFSTAVTNLAFDFEHVNDDGSTTYDDKWTIYIYDHSGALIPSADVVAAISGLVDESVTVNPDGSVSIEAEGTNSNDVSFNLSGYAVSNMELVYEPGAGGSQTGGSGISDLTFDIPPDADGDGVADEFDIDADGDGILNTDEYGTTTPQNITIVFDGDEWAAGETSWVLKDPSGAVIASDANTLSTAETTTADVTTLGSYTLEITDTYGDGLAGSNLANYQIYVDGELVYASPNNENFGGFTSTTFDVASTVGPIDTDGDGVYDHLDLDSDNDGITDNVEAQATGDYAAPTGLDSDSDGLDDAYEGTGDEGLSPVNTDGNGPADFRNTDSDGDGLTDAQEAGHGVSQATIDASGDADGDGIKDAVDDVAGWDVNDADINGAGEFTLADSDNDTAANGIGATPQINDLDFRDNTPADGTVEGTSGNDVIDASYTGDPDGDRVDANDAILPGHGSNDDLIIAGAGDDTVIAGAGNDTIEGGTGNDSIDGGTGDDKILFGDGNDIVSGGDGNDFIDDLEGALGTGANSVDGGAGNDTIFTGGSDDTLSGGSGNDQLYGETGNDTLDGGTGTDNLYGGTGSDTFHVADNHDTTAIVGGEDGDGSDIDTLDFTNAATTAGVTVTLSGSEAGTFNFAGASSSGSFSEIEQIMATENDDFIDASASTTSQTIDAGGGNDTVYGGSAADDIALGDGADTVDAGTGNDTIDLGDDGSGGTDKKSDVVILADGDGNDIITNFDAPLPNGDGTYTGIDTLDVSAVTTGTRPVNVNDVVVTDTNGDGTGDAILTFPDGTSVTLVGISPTDADNPFYLNAIGIPLSDGTVSGTSGADLIDTSYTGDPDGDRVDNNDAILPGDTGDDDLIEAGAGDDTIFAGAGDDSILGEAGNDTIFGGDGADSIDGGTGDNIIYGGDGNDNIRQGGTTGDNSTIYGEGGDDTIELVSGAGPAEVYGGDGNDFIVDNGSGSNGDTIDGGAGDDNILGGEGNDTYIGGTGNDTIDGSGGDDILVLGDNDGEDFLDGGVFGETAGDTLDATSMTNNVTLDLTASGTVGGGGGPEGPEGPGGPGGPGGGGGTYDASLTDGGINTAYLANIEQYNLGSGSDTVIASTGDDNVHMGDGADTLIVTDGLGNDTIDGGVLGGNDSIDASALTTDVTVNLTAPETGTLSDSSGTITFAEIEEITTGAGNDTITLSTGDDTVSSGAGDDIFNVSDGFGNDVLTGGEGGETVIGDVLNGAGLTEAVTVTLTGPEAGTMTNGTDTTTFQEFERVATGAGDDTIIGGAGNDIVDAGTGDDTMSGGAGNDELFGNDGNDTIDGGAGDDTIYGGFDNDVISGGTGADTLLGEDGNDTITFAEGDSVSGGDGDDTFTLADLGEPTNGTITVTGGNDGELSGGDTLELGDLADMSTLVKTSNGLNASGNETFSGSVTLDDGTLLTFSEIENIICFTPGTLIATPKGARDIATLQIGDLVVTRDHGLQPIRWIQSRTVPAAGKFAPIRIRPGVVTGLERDLLVSPQHRMLFQGYRAELLFGESEVLVAAKHLVDGKDVTQDEGGDVTYIHMMFDEHEIVYADGAASESFHPGKVGLDAVSDPARDELFALFPDLRSNVNGYGRTARRCLKSHEARLLNC